MQVSDVFWVSTYIFALVYTPQSGSDKTPNSVFLSATVRAQLYLGEMVVTWWPFYFWCFQKDGGSPTFVSADDVYCGNGDKLSKFHFSYLKKWWVNGVLTCKLVSSWLETYWSCLAEACPHKLGFKLA